MLLHAQQVRPSNEYICHVLMVQTLALLENSLYLLDDPRTSDNFLVSNVGYSFRFIYTLLSPRFVTYPQLKSPFTLSSSITLSQDSSSHQRIHNSVQHSFFFLNLHQIRIHHECEDRREKSVPMIVVWHHEACRVMTKGDP